MGRIFTCKFCKRCFGTREKRDEHEAVHDTLKNSCEWCHWMFSELSDLEQHSECCNKRPFFTSTDKTVMGLFAAENDGKSLVAVRTTVNKDVKVNDGASEAVSEDDDGGVNDHGREGCSTLAPLSTLSLSLGQLLEPRSAPGLAAMGRPTGLSPEKSDAFGRTALPGCHVFGTINDVNSLAERSEKGDLSSQRKNSSKVVLQCNICGIQFSRRDVLMTHLGAHEVTKQIEQIRDQGEVSSLGYDEKEQKTGKRALNSTSISKKRMKSSDLACAICARKFRKRERLENHIENHDIMVYHCLGPCTWMFQKREAFQQHLANVHNTILSKKNEFVFVINPGKGSGKKHKSPKKNDSDERPVRAYGTTNNVGRRVVLTDVESFGSENQTQTGKDEIRATFGELDGEENGINGLEESSSGKIMFESDRFYKRVTNQPRTFASALCRGFNTYHTLRQIGAIRTTSSHESDSDDAHFKLPRKMLEEVQTDWDHSYSSLTKKETFPGQAEFDSEDADSASVVFGNIHREINDIVDDLENTERNESNKNFNDDLENMERDESNKDFNDDTPDESDHDLRYEFDDVHNSEMEMIDDGMDNEGEDDKNINVTNEPAQAESKAPQNRILGMELKTAVESDPVEQVNDEPRTSGEEAENLDVGGKADKKRNEDSGENLVLRIEISSPEDDDRPPESTAVSSSNAQLGADAQPTRSEDGDLVKEGQAADGQSSSETSCALIMRNASEVEMLSPTVSTTSATESFISTPTSSPTDGRSAVSSPAVTWSPGSNVSRGDSSTHGFLNVKAKSSSATTNILNPEEQCCLIAMKDTFSSFSPVEVMLAKQDILRVLCNIEFHSSTPSAVMFNIRPLGEVRDLIHSLPDAHRLACDFCENEVFPVLRRLDRKRRKLASVEIQRILFNIQFCQP